MTHPAPLRLATRSSPQARTQAESVAEAIRVATGRRVELVFVDTFGDRTQSTGVPLHSIGGQGVFVKEVQHAVLDGRADLAVHSAKDLPSETADGLTLAAFTERRAANDVLVGRPFERLPEGATVATGSVRRRAQLTAIRPDLRFDELRGNIATRLEKVPDGGAIVMALAALQILDLTDQVAEVVSIDHMVPAVGQGCVAIECRSGDERTLAAASSIDHAGARTDVEIERAFLAELGSGCSLPVGGHAVDGTFRAFLADPDAGRHEQVVLELPADRRAALDTARRVAHDLRRTVEG